MKKIIIPLLVVAVVVIIGLSAVGDITAQQRWYTPEQVAKGDALYQKHCRECHGISADASLSWGNSVEGAPPPLDGTGYSWQRPLPLLRLIIRDGGAKLGGTMPPFSKKMSAEEIDAVIAWFQSLWDIETYTRWSEQGSSASEKY
jgi:mono/diheme cytochrome c family protein